MVRVREGAGSREQGVEGASEGCADSSARVVRSGSAAAKEVKSWVPRMKAAAC